MKKLNLILLSLLSITIVSCKTFDQRQMETLGVGVYATSAAIDVGRIDVAKEYNESLKKYIPKPQKKVEVKGIPIKKSTSKKDIIKEENYIILPPNLQGKNVVVKDSQEWNTLVLQNEELQKQLEKEKKEFYKYEEQIRNLIIAKEKEIEKLKEEKKKGSLWGKISGFFTFLLWAIPIVGAGLGVLCFFNPALAFTILQILSKIAQIVMEVFYAIVNWIVKIIEFVKNWSKDDDDKPPTSSTKRGKKKVS